MKTEISEYIVARVLDHSDILIRDAQRRLPHDIELRQELWANIANKLSHVFDISMDHQKVKQHFLNRRKGVMRRVTDDLKRHRMEDASVDEKMDWIKNRQVLVNEKDLQIVEYALKKEQDRDTKPAPPMVVPATNVLNELVKTDSNPSGEVSLLEDGTEEDPSTGKIVDSSEPMSANVCSNPQLFLPTSNKSTKPSQVVVQVPNKQKRAEKAVRPADRQRLYNFCSCQRDAAEKLWNRALEEMRRISGSSDSDSNKKQHQGVTELQNNFASLPNGHESSDPVSLFSETTAKLLFEMSRIQPKNKENDEEEKVIKPMFSSFERYV